MDPATVKIFEENFWRSGICNVTEMWPVKAKLQEAAEAVGVTLQSNKTELNCTELPVQLVEFRRFVLFIYLLYGLYTR